MTQSFVHCTHHLIFGYYFPPAFRNWYSDDWATQVTAFALPRRSYVRRTVTSIAARALHMRGVAWAQVYGKRNSFWRRDVEVNHALAHLGPRYKVSYEDKAIVDIRQYS